MESGGSGWSQARALSLSEKGNSCRRIALVDTPFSFNVPHTSKKIESWRLGSSIGEPPNWDGWTIDMSAGLNSKLFTSTFGRAMLEKCLKLRELWNPRVSSLTSCSCVHLWGFFLSLTPLLKPLLLSPYTKGPFNLWIGFICKWTSHKRKDRPASTKPTLPVQSKVEWKIKTKTLSHFQKINLIFREIGPWQWHQKLHRPQAHG